MQQSIHMEECMHIRLFQLDLIPMVLGFCHLLLYTPL
ncbi:hypothetical protein OIU74_007598, partial [Salix koriyanagi]